MYWIERKAREEFELNLYQKWNELRETLSLSGCGSKRFQTY